jgi:WD40 repeat protein
VATGQKLLTLPGPASLERANLYFTPDGRWLAIIDCNGTVVLRDADSGEEDHRFVEDGVCITGIAFSPDGKLIAINSPVEGNLRILEIETGRTVVILTGGYRVDFTPDGTRLIVAAEGQGLVRDIVRVYLVRLEDLVALARTRLTRSLSAEECQRYLHGAPCPGGP